MCSFRLKLVEFYFRVATRFAQAEYHRHHRFFAASGYRCDAGARFNGAGRSFKSSSGGGGRIHAQKQATS